MQLPNAEHAIVAVEKLRDYCLNLEHPRGRHKARVFIASTGLTADHLDNLRNILLRMAREGDCVPTYCDEFGQRYALDFMLRGPTGQARVRSTWIIRTNEDFPRLTSCYML